MITILLPAYNEERDICALLYRIQQAMQESQLDYKVLVVNDGSTDGTAGIVLDCQRDIPLELINHEVNQNLGRAMMTGLKAVVKQMRDEDVLVTMDADNTHDPALIPAMLQKMSQGSGLVIASRYEAGGREVGLSRLRSFLSRGASALLSLFFPIAGAKDYTCGYRAYRGAVLKDAFRAYSGRLVEERGFTCMAEILIKMRRLQVQVAEVPLVLRYDLKSGRSKMKVWRTILRYLVLVARNIVPRETLVKGAQIDEKE